MHSRLFPNTPTDLTEFHKSNEGIQHLNGPSITSIFIGRFRKRIVA